MLGFLYAIVRIAWVWVFGFMAAKWGWKFDEAIQADVIQWTNTTLLVFGAGVIEVWQHLVFPRIVRWYENRKLP